MFIPSRVEIKLHFGNFGRLAKYREYLLLLLQYEMSENLKYLIILMDYIEAGGWYPYCVV